MHNSFLASTKSLIDRNGKVLTYVSVAEGSYNIETGSTTNTNTNHSVKLYKRHIRANQYNYPNLIGQESATFYLTNYKLQFVPAVRDKIIDSSGTYTVDSITEHVAGGEIILYKLVAVKG